MYNINRFQSGKNVQGSQFRVQGSGFKPNQQPATCNNIRIFVKTTSDLDNMLVSLAFHEPTKYNNLIM